MRVLVVDAFSGTAEDRRLCKEFCNGIRSGLAKIDVGAIKIEYAVKEDLSRYIYKSADPRCGTSGLKTFDRLDMVFIGAEANILPWEDRALDLLLLMKMCYVTKKCLFGSSAMAHFAAFCCVANGVEVTPLNGTNGTSLCALDADAFGERVKAEGRDVFLDNENGDLYRYNRFHGIWAPYTSIGFRKTRNIVREHVAKVVQSHSEPILSKSNETVCRKAKKAVNHWLFKGIPKLEFKVCSKPTWTLDNASNLKSGKPCHVLATNQGTPLILKATNMICVHFDVSTEYPETIQILHNVIANRISRLQHHGYVDLSSHLYLAFHSQTEAVFHRGAPKAKEHSWKDNKRASVASKISVMDGGNLKPTKWISPPEIAKPSDCTFLRNSRSEYSLVRSNSHLLAKKESRRPQPYYKRKSNYAFSAQTPTNQSHDHKHSMTSQKARVDFSRSSRAGEIVFPSAITRPRSAPLRQVHRSTPEQLLQAGHSIVPKTPLYDKFGQKNLVAQTLALQNRSLTPTHNLRVFRGTHMNIGA